MCIFTDISIAAEGWLTRPTKQSRYTCSSATSPFQHPFTRSAPAAPIAVALLGVASRAQTVAGYRYDPCRPLSGTTWSTVNCGTGGTGNRCKPSAIRKAYACACCSAAMPPNQFASGCPSGECSARHLSNPTALVHAVRPAAPRVAISRYLPTDARVVPPRCKSSRIRRTGPIRHLPHSNSLG